MDNKTNQADGLMLVSLLNTPLIQVLMKLSGIDQMRSDRFCKYVGSGAVHLSAKEQIFVTLSIQYGIQTRN